MIGRAEISPCGRYRYLLYRHLDWLCMIETESSDGDLAMVEAALDARDRRNMAANVK